MNPLKQGLKQGDRDLDIAKYAMHLSMNPLKQGLKLCRINGGFLMIGAFIHESIKTRVETGFYQSFFLSYSAFIHESIKTRVETTRLRYPPLKDIAAFIHESIKTRVETSRLLQDNG